MVSEALIRRFPQYKFEHIHIFVTCAENLSQRVGNHLFRNASHRRASSEVNQRARTIYAGTNREHTRCGDIEITSLLITTINNHNRTTSHSAGGVHLRWKRVSQCGHSGCSTGSQALSETQKCDALESIHRHIRRRRAGETACPRSRGGWLNASDEA